MTLPASGDLEKAAQRAKIIAMLRDRAAKMGMEPYTIRTEMSIQNVADVLEAGDGHRFTNCWCGGGFRR